MDESDALTVIYDCLRACRGDERIKEFTLDGDHHDAEVVLSLYDGEKVRNFLIRAKDITEA